MTDEIGESGVTQERRQPGMNTVQHNIVTFADTDVIFLGVWRGIDQAGAALAVRSARPC